jgi:ABC-type antimicrobial peptide transport system permease subunit
MGQRTKMVIALLVIGIIGFLLGVVANIVYYKALPFMLESFPQLFMSEWALWGLIGALLAVICSLIYAYLP